MGKEAIAAGQQSQYYVIDLRHYMDEDGDLADLPGPALTLAMVFTSVVAWATAIRRPMACR